MLEDQGIEQEKPEIDGSPEIDEQEEYGKKVNKRINKLVYERNIEREAREKEREARERLEKENEELKRRFDGFEERFEESHIETRKESIESKLAEKRRRRSELMEEGDFSAADQLDDEILELRLQQRDLETTRRREPKKKEEKGEAKDEKPVEQEAQPIPKAMQEWLNNNSWFGENTKAPKAIYAEAIVSELINEGYDTADNDLYQELDKRLGFKSKEKPPPTAPVDRGQSTGRTRGDVVLTESDLRQMEDLGLDSNNPDHRAARLAAKKEMLARGN